MRFRKNKKKKNVDVEEFDITSLLDILVILLVFLLKSFNDSDLTLDLVNELALPYSMSRSATNSGVILQVNAKRNVFINTDLVGNLNSPNTVLKVQEVLKDEFSKQLKRVKAASKKGQIINFVFDRALTFSEIDKMMNITSEVGYDKYKLIIQGEQ